MNSFIIQCHVLADTDGCPVEVFEQTVLSLSAENDGDDYAETELWEDDHTWNPNLTNCIYKLTIRVDLEYHKDYFGEYDFDREITVLSEEKFKTFGDLKRWWKAYKQFI